jgi:DNA-binding CsgD family transcriptional regulator/tetratricopeptide (TPR) repeat protein
VAYDALQLFVDRARTARPGFVVDDDTTEVIGRICARLDGLPLAIELAAAQVKTLMPRHILAGIDDCARLLGGGPRTAAARQQTLHASIEWSHDLLSDAERTLFRRLSVFAGEFSIEAAEEVCGSNPLRRPVVIPLLSRLVDKSLVLFNADVGRYRLLQTIRDFGGAQLAEAGETDSTCAAHAACFVAMAEAAAGELQEGPRPERLDALEADHDNLRAALEWALTADDQQTANRLVAALALFWAVRGHYSEGQRWCRRVLATAPVPGADLGGGTTWALAHLSLMGMDVANGYGAAEAQALTSVATELDSPTLLGRALLHQGLLQLFVFPASAQALLEQAIQAARRGGDTWALGLALSGLATYWVLDRGRPDLAAPPLGELSAVAESTGSPYWAGLYGVSAGLSSLRAGRLGAATKELEQALASALSLGDPQLETFAVASLADVHVAAGAYERAATMVAESVERQARSAQGRQELLELRLAVISLALGDLEGARRQLEAIEATVRQISMPVFVAQYDSMRGRLALEEGDLARATSLLEEAAAIGATIESPWEQAEVAIYRARLDQAKGDFDAAESHYHQALEVATEHDFGRIIADALEGLGALAAGGESDAEATRLLAAAESIRDATGLWRWPLDEPLCTDATAAARRRLGDAQFRELWNEGSARSPEDVVAYVRRGRGQRRRPTWGWASLTPTELEVVVLAGQGLTNAEIGRRLFMAAGTVKIHLSHVYAKVGVGNRAELAAKAAVRNPA